MRKVVVIMSIALVVGAAAFSWRVFRNLSTSNPESQTERSATDTKQLNPEEHNFVDSDFAKRMIVHNQQGIQIAEVAEKSAVNEEVRKLAASINDELSNSTEQYINWLTEWDEEYFELSYFPEEEGHDAYPTHPGMASLSDLHALESATGSFVDELFLRLMIAHHEGAAEMARVTADDRMQFGEMISLKNETLKNQAEEIQKMKHLQLKGE